MCSHPLVNIRLVLFIYALALDIVLDYLYANVHNIGFG